MNKKIFKIIITFSLLFILVFPSFATERETSNANGATLQEQTEDQAIGSEIKTYLEYYVRETFNYVFSISKDQRDFVISLVNGAGQNKSASFLQEIYNKSSDLGNYIGIDRLETYSDNGALETRLLLQFENGYLTTNISYNKNLPYLSVMLYNGISTEYLPFDNTNLSLMNVYEDYYIRKGNNPSQVIGMKYFYRNVSSIIVFLIVILIIAKIYKAKSKNKIYKSKNISNENIMNDTKLVAAIMGALIAYTGLREDQIHIKTIRKVKWNR